MEMRRMSYTSQRSDQNTFKTESPESSSVEDQLRNNSNF